MNIDTSKVTNVFVTDIDFKDAPDFTDAQIESADYDGVEMTEDQLIELSEDCDFVYNAIINQIY